MMDLNKLRADFSLLKYLTILLWVSFKKTSISSSNVVVNILPIILNSESGSDLKRDFKHRVNKLKWSFSRFTSQIKKCIKSCLDVLTTFPEAFTSLVSRVWMNFKERLKKIYHSIPLGEFGKDPEMRVLILIVLSILALGILFSLIVSLSTIYNENLYSRDLCFSDKCINFFLSSFPGVSIILQSVAWLITLITTIGGITIALMTYKTGVRNSNLSNHISHLNMFRDYVNAEISKRKFISPDKVNIYKWYSLIFPLSKKGDVSVSLDYKGNIDTIVSVIMDANYKITEVGGKYVYIQHQASMLSAISLLGIKVSSGPKNEFILIEEQLFELIDCINLTFTNINTELSSVKRAYV